MTEWLKAPHSKVAAVTNPQTVEVAPLVEEGFGSLMQSRH